MPVMVMGNVRQMIEVTKDDARTALAVERWADDIAEQSPYENLDALLDAAFDGTPLTTSEIDEAIAHHPRIGEKPVGEGKSQDFSRSEQGSDESLAEELAAGNAAYEARFGRVFIIRAAGLSRADILAALTERLELDADEELEIVGEQLRDIAILRLEKMFA
jgi:2-oxo-4-hydroxy-4-carboxy-5-ureidoimidazoline decarboxylase